MKHLKKITGILFLTLYLAASCSKDEAESSTSTNLYTYQNVQTQIVEAESLNQVIFSRPNTYLSLKGEIGSSKYVQLFFSGSATIPLGTMTYKDNSDNNYDPTKHFSGGSINLGIANSHSILGGKVIVSKSGENYTVKVEASTSRGPLVLNYTGTVKKL